MCAHEKRVQAKDNSEDAPARGRVGCSGRKEVPPPIVVVVVDVRVLLVFEIKNEQKKKKHNKS